MNLKEFYFEIGGDFEGVISRLYNEEFVKKFVFKFVTDTSYENLCTAMAEQNVDDAFRYAHTLKGVCQNLGFDRLFKISSKLTEILRAGKMPFDNSLLKDTEKEYNLTVKAIEKLKNS